MSGEINFFSYRAKSTFIAEEILQGMLNVIKENENNFNITTDAALKIHNMFIKHMLISAIEKNAHVSDVTEPRKTVENQVNKAIEERMNSDKALEENIKSLIKTSSTERYPVEKSDILYVVLVIGLVAFGGLIGYVIGTI